MKFFKKMRCNHDYHEIGSYERKVISGGGSLLDSKVEVVLFCPKCDKEKHIKESRYDIEEAKKEVRRKYNKSLF